MGYCPGTRIAANGQQSAHRSKALNIFHCACQDFSHGSFIESAAAP